LALQLWACERPHAGGAIAGHKVAEAAVDLRGGLSDRHHLRGESFARMPASRRDFAMVLVLAVADAGSEFERVHDFANYPARQAFLAPYLEPPFGYTIENDEVTIRAGRVVNPRLADNLSGSLAIELRALTGNGAELAGKVVTRISLGCLAGQASMEGVELRGPLLDEQPIADRMALVLVEYTAEGFAARDAHPIPAAEGSAAERRVSIQSASVESLASVPGINRKLALEIVKARPYRSLEDLVRARGIGEKMLRKLRHHLRL
jgi:DNA uptake protein ComE-like DNA-binding protein